MSPSGSPFLTSTAIICSLSSINVTVYVFVLHDVSNNIDKRCNYCYADRLLETAKYAKENGYDAFCTSMLYSIYQDHDKIKEVAERISKEIGIDFYYYDFRPYYKEGQEEAAAVRGFRSCGERVGPHRPVPSGPEIVPRGIQDYLTDLRSVVLLGLKAIHMAEHKLT